MAFRSLQRRKTGREPGFALMEAVVAAGFSALALSASLLILNRQNQIANRARDLSLIQAAVNDDIAAIRQFARHWNWLNSPYANTSNFSNTATYTAIYSAGASCSSFTSKGMMEFAARSDLASYSKQFSGSYPIAWSGATKTVPGFQIRRQISRPGVTTQDSKSTSTTPTDDATYTFRVTYTVFSEKKESNGTVTFKPYPFNQTADILLLAQLSC